MRPTDLGRYLWIFVFGVLSVDGFSTRKALLQVLQDPKHQCNGQTEKPIPIRITWPVVEFKSELPTIQLLIAVFKRRHIGEEDVALDPYVDEIVFPNSYHNLREVGYMSSMPYEFHDIDSYLQPLNYTVQRFPNMGPVVFDFTDGDEVFPLCLEEAEDMDYVIIRKRFKRNHSVVFHRMRMDTKVRFQQGARLGKSFFRDVICVDKAPRALSRDREWFIQVRPR